MSRKALLLLPVVTAMACFLAAPAQAGIIQLEGGLNKIKFTNFEYVINAAGQRLNPNAPGFQITAGDRFVGILNVTSIGTIANSNDLSAQLLTKQLTGVFQISVVNGSLTPGSNGHLDFAMKSGDYISLYANTTHTFTAGAAGGASVDIAHAKTGTLWASVTGPVPDAGTSPNSLLPAPSGPFYEGVSDTTGAPNVTTENKNFLNFAVNNSGYTFAQEFFSTLTGEPTAHTYTNPPNGPLLRLDVKSQLFFVSHLFTPSGVGPNWDFRSEDPAYLFVPVPEPASMISLAIGALGTGLFYMKKRKTKRALA